MKSLVACLLPLFLLLLASTIWPQRVPQSLPSSPPPVSASPVPIIPPTAAGTRTSFDPAHLRQQAQQLLQLSQEIQPEIESVNHGVLPKETIAKLKQIEKLSKSLRSQLTPK